jgi:uncharacterized membrane protein YdjX (TVP38/TMEM64 family)
VKETIIQLFTDHAEIAILISILISIIIAVAGILPSVFLTAANILFFGFWNGLLISFIGESIGAVIAFVLYRKGFKKISTRKLSSFPKLELLLHSKGKEAFLLILYLRLIPFVPSGLVTFCAAIGDISLLQFSIASSLGKIPALLLEAYSSYQVMEFGWQGKLILAVCGIALVAVSMRSMFLQNKNRD